MMYYTKKKNTPVATLIKRYLNKKSGKVTDSRAEIQWRFDYLDWKDQKKIMLAFLDSGKTDRQWAYLKLLDFWDEAFEEKVKALWEQYHEDKCAWVVIRHLPVEYIVQNMDKFTGRRDYYFICLRLARDKNYVIDKDKLNDKDYLAVLYHTCRSVDPDEAEDILYQTVHKVCMTYFAWYETWVLNRYQNIEVGSIVTPINYNPVSHVLYYIRKLNCDFVVERFGEWNATVQEAIAKSPEYKKLLKEGLSAIDYRYGIFNISRRYAYLALDKRYKKPTDPPIDEVLEPKDESRDDPEYEQKLMEMQQTLSTASPVDLQKMIDKNPHIADLMDGLDLSEEIPF